MNTKIYLDFIRDTLKKEGLKVADTANKLALKMNAITLDQYRLATGILAAEILKR